MHRGSAAARSLRLLMMLAVLIAALALCGAGVVIGARQGWLQPVVKVHIVNQTGAAVSDVQLRFKSAGQSGVLQLPGLAHGERTLARFYLAGEGQFDVQARMPGGQLVATTATYVESGYEVTEQLRLVDAAPPRPQQVPMR